MYCFGYETAIGAITVADDGCNVVIVKIGRHTLGECRETALGIECAAQLREYLNGARKRFNLPIKPIGSEFQLKVWEALLAIPYGETRCYREVAEVIGSPKAARAVGMANNRNPLHVVVPCHRVIGANGSLTGYAAGEGVKAKLLELEKAFV